MIPAMAAEDGAKRDVNGVKMRGRKSRVLRPETSAVRGRSRHPDRMVTALIGPRAAANRPSCAASTG